MMGKSLPQGERERDVARVLLDRGGVLVGHDRDDRGVLQLRKGGEREDRERVGGVDHQEPVGGLADPDERHPPAQLLQVLLAEVQPASAANARDLERGRGLQVRLAGEDLTHVVRLQGEPGVADGDYLDLPVVGLHLREVAQLVYRVPVGKRRAAGQALEAQPLLVAVGAPRHSRPSP